MSQTRQQGCLFSRHLTGCRSAIGPFSWRRTLCRSTIYHITNWILKNAHDFVLVCILNWASENTVLPLYLQPVCFYVSRLLNGKQNNPFIRKYTKSFLCGPDFIQHKFVRLTQVCAQKMSTIIPTKPPGGINCLCSGSSGIMYPHAHYIK